jgi:hypothetical protein
MNNVAVSALRHLGSSGEDWPVRSLINPVSGKADLLHDLREID